MRLLLWVVVLAACRGEEVVAPTADAADASDAAPATDAADAFETATGDAPADAADPEDALDAADAAPDGGACGVPGDLLRNGSFEKGSGTVVDDWTDGRLSRRKGSADDCEYWAALDDLAPWTSVSEAIAIDAPAGTTFDYGFSFKSLDGKTSPPTFFLSGAGDDSTFGYAPPLPATGEWVRAQRSFTLSKSTTKIVIGFNTDIAERRALGVDRAWVVKR